MEDDKSPVNAKKILIIDPDHGFRAAAAEFLRSNGFEVHAEASGQEGIRKALFALPDLILLARALGDMDSHDAFFWLGYMKRTKAIPVIVVSAGGGSAVFRKYPSCRRVFSKNKPLCSMLSVVRLALGAA